MPPRISSPSCSGCTIARFEIVGVGFDWDDNSDVRRRLVNSLDAFHDVRTRSDHDVATLLHELEIDIAVDLKATLAFPPCSLRTVVLRSRRAT